MRPIPAVIRILMFLPLLTADEKIPKPVLPLQPVDTQLNLGWESGPLDSGPAYPANTTFQPLRESSVRSAQMGRCDS